MLRAAGSSSRPRLDAAVLRTVAAVAARATARPAVRYGQLRVQAFVTGGVTLVDILVPATTGSAAKLECQAGFVLTVVAGSIAIAALCMAAASLPATPRSCHVQISASHVAVKQSLRAKKPVSDAEIFLES